MTHIASATTLVSYKNTKVLTDPWIVGDEYYGSWTHYPPIEIDYTQFDDVDYIYISHIHPDHMSRATLEKINPDIPVLIHKYDAKFVKTNLERWGRKVIELDHGEAFHCGDGLNIYIYAADNCNPELCFKFFGCGKMESKFGSTSIDTMSVFETNEKTLLNVNDCPYALSSTTIDKILEIHKKIDLLLVGYAGASAYPHCWDYSEEDKKNIYAPKFKAHYLNSGLRYINKVNPSHYMPFAGTYTLQGKNAILERHRAVPQLDEALEYYKNHVNANSKGFLLNSFDSFDLKTSEASSVYTPIDYEEKISYVESILIKHRYEFEDDPDVKLEQVLSLLDKAYSRFEQKRKEINFKSLTNIYIYLPCDKLCKISCSGEGIEIINVRDFQDSRYVSYKLDYKLLLRILKGPKYAHWNNAEIGSHIRFSRKPEMHERGLYFSMNYFHA